MIKYILIDENGKPVTKPCRLKEAMKLQKQLELNGKKYKLKEVK